MPMGEPDLVKKLECLRRQLQRLFTEKGSFLDPQVIAVSQEMDQLIVRFHQYNSLARPEM